MIPVMTDNETCVADLDIDHLESYKVRQILYNNNYTGHILCTYIILNVVLKDMMLLFMRSGGALWLISISSINAINENLDVVNNTNLASTLTPSSKIDLDFIRF